MLLHGKRRPHLIDDSLPAVHERIVKRVRMQVSANSRAVPTYPMDGGGYQSGGTPCIRLRVGESGGGGGIIW